MLSGNLPAAVPLPRTVFVYVTKADRVAPRPPSYRGWRGDLGSLLNGLWH